MKRSLLFLIFGMFFIQSCSWVEPNYEGILMTNCGRNGLQDFTIVTGKVNTWGICTELIEVPMFEQTGDVEELAIYCKDGGQFKIDPAYTYSAVRGKGKYIAFTYRHLGANLDDIETNVLNRRVVNAYREVAASFTTDSLLNNKNLFESAVESQLTAVFDSAYFKLIELTSGLTPPESMAKAIEQRNTAIQEALRVQNELQREKAKLEIETQKARADVEIARLQALANLEKAKGLTPQVLQEMTIKGWIEKGCPMPDAVGSSGFYNMINPK